MTTYYDRKKTADYSPLLVHFTRNRRFTSPELLTETDPLFPFLNTSGLEKLQNIMRTGTIYASPMPFLRTDPKAVCFTECIWEALVELSDRYSPYGLVYSKRLIFRKGGGPALYVRGDVLKTTLQSFPSELEPMIAPFDPEGVLIKGTVLDWLHEREWRLPGPLNFEDWELEFVIVDSIVDVETLVDEFGTSRVPRNKIIPMEVYRTIRSTWGPA